MNSEKITTAPSGYLAFVVVLVLIAAAALCFWAELPAAGAIIFIVDLVFILPGLAIVNPNESKVLTLFGKYVGTVKQDGFFWVNPFTVKRKVSLRAFNLNGQQLKVNDSVGNPIEIAAVIVCK
jgi:regulator of protease activity HflC (stomatin/prohibitin superfamily)